MSTEHLRVVPPYRPKPRLSVAEIKARKKATDNDLFAGKPGLAPANAHLIYKKGPLIQNVEVFTIYWGQKWSTSLAAKKLITKLNAFFDYIVTSPLIDQLAEYNTPKFTIGHGSFTGTLTITDNAPTASVTDTEIKAALQGWIAAQTIPAPNANTLYFVYTDLRVAVHMGGGASCTSFCGYHNHVGNQFYYAVMPFPTCTGCLGGLSTLDALTGTSSHELCEAITDPIPGKGWYDPVNGEIGDICPWVFKTLGGYNVQLEWSNAQDKCA
jgi:hypothetical protein